MLQTQQWWTKEEKEREDDHQTAPKLATMEDLAKGFLRVWNESIYRPNGWLKCTLESPEDKPNHSWNSQYRVPENTRVRPKPAPESHLPRVARTPRLLSHRRHVLRPRRANCGARTTTRHHTGAPACVRSRNIARNDTVAVTPRDRYRFGPVRARRTKAEWTEHSLSAQG